jgi:hypothetical protein
MTSHGSQQLLRGGALDSANPQTGAGHLGALLAAALACERGLDIGQPDTIGPSIAADRGRTAALVILTVDKQTARAGVAHLSKGDLRRAGESGHAPLKPSLSGQANRAMGWAWNTSETHRRCHSFQSRLRTFKRYSLFDAPTHARQVVLGG